MSSQSTANKQIIFIYKKRAILPVKALSHTTLRRKIMKKYLLLIGISISLNITSLFSAQADKKEVPVTDTQVRHYVTHILTDILGKIGAGLTAATVIGTGAAITAISVENAKMHVPPGEPPAVAFVPVAVSAIIGSLACIYIYYKTPQWTDTYALGYKRERTTSQNIVTLLSRAFIPLPIVNVVAGEYLAGTVPGNDSSDK